MALDRIRVGRDIGSAALVGDGFNARTDGPSFTGSSNLLHLTYIQSAERHERGDALMRLPSSRRSDLRG